jgi:hypothetical protein
MASEANIDINNIGKLLKKNLNRVDELAEFSLAKKALKGED